MSITSLNCPFCGVAIPLQDKYTVKECPSCHKPLHAPAGKKNETGVVKLEQPQESKPASHPDSSTAIPSKPHFDRLGPYQIVRCIGKGGMGFVYEALDTRLNRRVALKTVESGDGVDDQIILRFRREAQNSAKLRHPHIVSVHDVGRDTGFDYFTMDLVEGVTFDRWLQQSQSTIRDRIRIMEKVSRALHYAHVQGVIHRDVKPGNIMIDGSGEPQIMDFGLARNTRDTSNLTLSGSVVGTPAFMAPEQTMGASSEVGPKADIWALGVILYESLLGRPPFDTGTVYQTIYAVLHNEPVAPRKVDPTIPKDVETIILRCLEKQVGKRYETAERLADDLHAWLEGRSIQARSLRWWEKWWKKIQQKRAISVDEFVLEQQARQRAEAQKLELQTQVERDNKREWKLVFEDNFSDADIESRWECVEGKHEMKDGELRIWNGTPQILYLKQKISGDVRLEFECYQLGDHPCDVSCFIQALPLANRKKACESGYLFQYGGAGNTRSFIERPNKRLWDKLHSPLISGEHYRVLIERLGPKLSFWVNDLLLCEVEDDEPLSDAERTSVGLYSWKADTRYVYFKAYQLGVPMKGDLLEIANRQLEKGRFESAADLFQEVIDSSEDPLRVQRAKQGIHVAKTKTSLKQSFQRYDDLIRSYWPNAKLQLTDKGLTLNIVSLEIKDLSPLAGIPLSELDCGGNQIESLEPLRGMKLTKLHFSGNKIHSLDALRDMPLLSLGASKNALTDLAPLANLPLETLSISENPNIQNYEALSKSSIHYLLCSANKIRDLNFLRGTALTRLSCHHNLISDLEPLRDLPIRGLQCGMNKISNLEPLHGKSMHILGFERNQITTLEALRDMKLAELRCQGNQLTSLEPLVDDPPRLFLFDSNALSIEELQRVAAIWDKQPINALHALHARIQIAFRNEDVSGLKKLAEKFEGAYYLPIPEYVRWKEAYNICLKYGGRLLNSQNESDIRFLESIKAPNLRYWLGNIQKRNGEIFTMIKGEKFSLKDDEIAAFCYWVDHSYFFSPGLDNSEQAFCIRWE